MTATLSAAADQAKIALQALIDADVADLRTDGPIDDAEGDRAAIRSAMLLLSVYIAQHDGPLSPQCCDAITSIFSMEQSPINVSSMQVEAPQRDKVEAAVKMMATCVTLRAALVPDLNSNLIVSRAQEVFDAALGEAGGAQTNPRLDEIMRRLQEAMTPSATAAAGDGASPRSPVDPAICPVRLHNDEACYAVSSVALYQVKNVLSRTNYRGFSGRVRITKGLSYRAGSYAVGRTTTQEDVHIADGTLCVTNQRLVFLSDSKNIDLPFNKLLSAATFPGVIQISRANAGDLVFDQVDTPTIEAFEELSGTSADDRLAELQGSAAYDGNDDDESTVGYRIGSAVGKSLAVVAVVILVLIVLIAITL